MAQDHTKSIIYYVSYLQDITSHCLGFTIDEHKWPNIISLQLNYLQKLICLLHNLITFHQLLDLDVLSL